MSEEQPTSTGWPPAATPARPLTWRSLSLPLGDDIREAVDLRRETRDVLVRLVTLWGKDVWLHETETAVYCRHCHRFLELDEIRAIVPRRGGHVWLAPRGVVALGDPTPAPMTSEERAAEIEKLRRIRPRSPDRSELRW